jgi:hypothetical protein
VEPVTSNDLLGARPQDPARTSGRFGPLAADAIRYWEPRRILYNLALVAVVGAHIVTGWPDSQSALSWDTAFVLILLAVLANICYCAAYAVDLFAQFSGVRDAWARRRWVLLTIGIVFAAVITHFFTMGLFAPPGSS